MRRDLPLRSVIAVVERLAVGSRSGTKSLRHQIDALIRASSFHEAKAAQIRGSRGARLDEFEDDVPCDFAVLTSFRGVAPSAPTGR